MHNPPHSFEQANERLRKRIFEVARSIMERPARNDKSSPFLRLAKENFKMVKLLDNIITNPSHYVEGRTIEPIFVIEEFGLCHHLACVLKYIARAGRKTSTINDLRKAAWYLDRELSRHQAGKASCISPLNRAPELKISDIWEDWKLSPHLGEVLMCILQSRQVASAHQKFHGIRRHFQSPDPKELDGDFSLVMAMKHLRLAISRCEPGDCQ